MISEANYLFFCSLAITDQILSTGACTGFTDELQEGVCAVFIILLGSTFVMFVPETSHRSDVLPQLGDTWDERDRGLCGREANAAFTEENLLRGSLITKGGGIYRCELQRVQVFCVSEGGRNRRRGRHCLSFPLHPAVPAAGGSEGHLLQPLLRAVFPSLRHVTVCARPLPRVLHSPPDAQAWVQGYLLAKRALLHFLPSPWAAASEAAPHTFQRRNSEV